MKAHEGPLDLEKPEKMLQDAASELTQTNRFSRESRPKGMFLTKISLPLASEKPMVECLDSWWSKNRSFGTSKLYANVVRNSQSSGYFGCPPMVEIHVCKSNMAVYVCVMMCIYISHACTNKPVHDVCSFQILDVGLMPIFIQMFELADTSAC